MKIAIITYHYSNNKGAFMQTYGLCKFLKERGYETELIDIRQSEDAGQPFYIKLLKWIIVGYRMQKDMQTFYPPLTRRYYSLEELRQDPPQADCYIVGSDQVWNPNISKNLMMAYFLDFGSKDIKRISYASSFGISKWIINDKTLNERIADLLKSFTGLSVREKEGQQLCSKEFGINPTVVLDPTFLNEDYSEFTENVKQKELIVCYKINKTEDFWRFAPIVKKELGLPITILNYNYPKRGYKYCFPPTLNYWMRSIAAASFVLTDSFHGAVFSIINKKKFAVILNHNDRDSRIINLVNEFGLQSRMFNSLEEMLQTTDWKNEIDYSLIEERIANRVRDSQDFLLKALQKV